MNIKQSYIAIVLSISIISPVTYAQDKHSETGNLELSPGLMNLLRTEMREILSGVQDIPTGIAMADWIKIADISSKIKSSYIMAQKITPEQKNELQHKLPEYFKKMDANFHMEARKLELAARKHDQQLVTFHYYRLIESCASCHSTYATKRFPGFMPEKTIEHHH